jgi:hypothetical protein
LSDQSEVILAQNQGVTMRDAGRKKEIEAEFGFDETHGTLVLTNKRLIFACTNEKEEDIPGENYEVPWSKIGVVYSEVEDIEGISQEPPNVFVPITAISSVRGHAEGIGRASIEVSWADAAGKHGAVFTQDLKRSGRNLNDWAPTIENIRAGRQRLVALPKPPSVDTLEGKVVRVLSDMQEKGLLVIEEAVETEFKVELDPDDVQAACENLASQGLLKRYPDSSGEVYYRKASPLGEDDLSS